MSDIEQELSSESEDEVLEQQIMFDGLVFNKELKFYDVEFTGNLNGAGVVMGSMNGILQGVSESERIGKRITIKRVKVEGYLTADYSKYENISKITLVLDKQANGALPAYLDVYDNISSINSFENIANSSRFVIMDTWKQVHKRGIFWDAVNNVESLGDKSHLLICGTHDVDIPILYKGSTSAVSEIMTNNFVMLGIWEYAIWGNVSYTINTRVYYYDY